MKIIDLVEMAIPTEAGPMVWKKINDLLNAGDYAAAAKHFVDSGGNVRGAKRTWNVAQANTKVSGKKVPGPIYGMVDKKHSYEKFMAAMPKEVTGPKTNKERNKVSKDPDELSDEYKNLAIIKRRKASHVKLGDAKGQDIARILSHDKKNPDSDPIKTLTARADELDLTAKELKRFKELRKKNSSGTDMTPEERGEYAKLKKSTLKKRGKAGIIEQAKKDIKEIESAEEIKNILAKYINDKTRIDDRDLVVTLLNKIRKLAKGDEATKINTQLKQIFRNKDNAPGVDNLIKKYNEETGKGLAHLKTIDSVLDRYNAGKDVSLAQLKTMHKEIEKMIPTMEEDQKFDVKGYSIYKTTERKLKAFIAKGEEPDVDAIEELLDGMSQYHDNLKKEVKKPIKKKNIKEDILYNLN